MKVRKDGVIEVQPVNDNGGSLTVDGTVAATQSGTWNINDISGTISLPTGAATETTLASILADTASMDTNLATVAGAVSGTEMQVDVLTMPTTTVTATDLDIRDLTSASDSVAAVQSGTWNVGTVTTVSTVTAVTDITNVVSVDDNGGSLTVDGTVTANHEVTSTATHSNVSGSATSVTLLSSNGSRRGATIYNDSTAILYLKLGATASTTSFTVKMYEDDFFQVPFGYTGVIDGIWASATGSARVVEFTA